MIWDPFSLSLMGGKRSLLYLMLHGVKRPNLALIHSHMKSRPFQNEVTVNLLLGLNPDPALQKTANGVTFALAALSNRSDGQYHNTDFAHKLRQRAENPPISEKVTVGKGLEAVEHNSSSNLQVQGDQVGRVYHLLLPKQPSEQKARDLAGDEELVLSVTILDATAAQ